MDQVPFPGPPLLFHLRLHALFVILWLVDIVMLVLAIDSTMSNGVGGAVLFANEVSACSILIQREHRFLSVFPPPVRYLDR